MSEFLINTTGGYEMMYTLFHGIASLLGADKGGFAKALVSMATGIAIISATIYALFSSHIRPLLNWFFSYVLILNGLFLPVSSVVIKDSMTGQFGKVDHVPFALAFTASTLNQMSYVLTSLLEQVFQGSPGSELEAKEAGVSRLAYTQTGFIFGAQAMMQMRGLQIANADFADNMKEFVQQCVVIDCLIGTKYTLHDLRNSTDIWALVSDRPSKIRGFTWREVFRDEGGRMTKSSASKIVTCAEGVSLINKIWKEATSSALTEVYDDLKNALGIKVRDEKLSGQILTNLPFAITQFTNASKGAAENVKQQLMIDTVVDASERKAVELGAAPNFEARRAYLMQRLQNETSGQVIAIYLPFYKTVMEALMYALFFFVFFMALLPKGWQIISLWFRGCLWVSLWPPLFAILNFFMTEALKVKVTGHMGAAGGMNIVNSVGIHNAAADMASLAGWLSLSIPMISWWIVDKSSYSLVNMAGSLLSSTQSSVSTATQEAFSGNYSYGNVSLNNAQAYQSTYFKQDTSPAYSSGHFTTNDGASSVMTGASGEQILNVGRSTLPVEIDSASYQESQYRDAYNREMGVHTSQSQQALQQKTLAAGQYLEFGKQASQMIASGEHFSNQESAQIAKDAASVYNRAKEISNQYGISEDIINQWIRSAGAGVSVGGSVAGFLSVHGNLGGENNETSNATIQKITNEISHLGQSKEFRESMQHMQQAVKSGSFETNNQNMKHLAQSMSSRLDESQQHQSEASKAMTRAQSINHNIENIRGNSQRINMVETQAFTNYAAEKLGGIEAVEEMAINSPNRLRSLGEQYLSERYGSASLPMNATGLRDSYHANPLGQNNIDATYHQNNNAVRSYADHEGFQPTEPIQGMKVQVNQMIDRGQTMTEGQSNSLMSQVISAEKIFENQDEVFRKGKMEIAQEKHAKEIRTDFLRGRS